MSYNESLTFSNLAYLLCALVLVVQGYRLKRNAYYWSWEISEYVMLCIISSLYHRCDSSDSIEDCIVFYDVLQFLDFFLSYIIFSTAVSPHLPREAFREFHKGIMYIITLLLNLYYFHNPNNIIIITLALLNVIAFLRFNHHRFTSLEQWKKRSTQMIVPSLLLIIAAVSCKFLAPQEIESPDDERRYVFMHSMWHALSALALTNFILFIEDNL